MSPNLADFQADSAASLLTPSSFNQLKKGLFGRKGGNPQSLKESLPAGLKFLFAQIFRNRLSIFKTFCGDLEKW